MGNELYDFKNVAPATASTYLKPGQYLLSVTGVTFDDTKTPYIEVSFANANGGTVKEKFFVTPNAVKRLQYLHTAWFGKELEKSFTSAEEIGAYFEKALMSKKVERRVMVGGQTSDDGRVFACLPYTNFIISDKAPFEEGEYEVGSVRYNDVVRRPAKNASTTSSAAILSTSDSKDDMPWSME